MQPDVPGPGLHHVPFVRWWEAPSGLGCLSRGLRQADEESGAAEHWNLVTAAERGGGTDRLFRCKSPQRSRAVGQSGTHCLEVAGLFASGAGVASRFGISQYVVSRDNLMSLVRGRKGPKSRLGIVDSCSAFGRNRSRYALLPHDLARGGATQPP